MIQEKDVSWAAGIIEGEGCFVFYPDKRSNHISTRIQVEMTDKDVLDKLHKLFGGRLVESNYPSKYVKNPTAKDSWRWIVSSQKEVFNCLLHIMPYLSVRRLGAAKKLFNHLEAKVVV